MDCSLTHPYSYRVAWEMAMDSGAGPIVPNENFSPSHEDGLLLDAAEVILKGIWGRTNGGQLTEEELAQVAEANEYASVHLIEHRPLWELLCLGESSGVEVIVKSLGPAGALLHEALASMFDGSLSYMLNPVIPGE